MSIYLKFYELVQLDSDTLKKALENKEININDLDEVGNSLLHVAAVENNPELVLFLLSNGVFVDVENHFYETPLHVACRAQAYNPIKILLNNNAGINKSTANGHTPLYYQIFQSDEKDINLPLSNYLIEKGARL